MGTDTPWSVSSTLPRPNIRVDLGLETDATSSLGSANEIEVRLDLGPMLLVHPACGSYRAVHR